MIFKSHTPNVKSVDYFKVKALGGYGSTVVKCVGTSKGPNLRLGVKHLSFGNVAAGSTATRIMQLENESDVVATFQVMALTKMMFFS